ncbi:MAG TPA: WYL domain-containing protein, partial [Longimicrobiales bacterium]|nr:WYL domain-containing protein [Longimicrobiales bacterium]
WYLIGHDATRDDIRVFRMGRMERPALAPGPDNQYDYDPDFHISDYARREPWELGDDAPLSCDVRFEFPLALWAERNGHGEKVEERTGGAVVRRFTVRQTEPFLRWLQSFGGAAIVEAPAEMRRAQAAMARETLEVYGG